MGSDQIIRPVVPDNIPDELKLLNQWVCWKAELKENGKLNKPPIDPKNGKSASHSNPDTWGTYEQALAYYEKHRNNGVGGIGFVLTKDDPYTGIDLDDCRNPETRELAPWAENIIKEIDSYSEISPSNKGMRIFTKGKLNGGGRKTKHVEIYDNLRYLTVTGGWIGSTSGRIESRQDKINWLVDKITENENIPKNDNASTDEKPNDLKNGMATDDNKIIDKMLESKNGEKIHKLLDGKWGELNYPSQSEADQALCCHIAFYTQDLEQIDRIFKKSGLYREKWDEKHYGNGKTYGQVTIEKAIASLQDTYKPKQDISARIREYLLDEFDGGTFRLSDLKRDLNLNDKEYTLARQCIKRMGKQGIVEKHGHQLGAYRVVDKRKTAIDWNETNAVPSPIILPGALHKVATIRAGDMIAYAAFKNQYKTATACEIVRLNLENFKINFFITEYRARMKQRLLDFGINLYHPNLKCYQIEKSDYIPDKIEPGIGVMNVIDHFPNLDNFYLVGKYQDEIHRGLDGAICVITHQKLKPNDDDAIGGSFWRITPTLAVSLFWNNDSSDFKGKMKIVKGKEPGSGYNNVDNLTLRYNVKKGFQFEYDEEWRFKQ